MTFINWNFLNRVIFSNETKYHTSAYVHRYNIRLHVFVEHEHDSPKIICLLCFARNHIINLFFFVERITSEIFYPDLGYMIFLGKSFWFFSKTGDCLNKSMLFMISWRRNFLKVELEVIEGRLRPTRPINLHPLLIIYWSSLLKKMSAGKGSRTSNILDNEFEWMA